MMARRSQLVPGCIMALLCAVLAMGLLYPLWAAQIFYCDHTKTEGDNTGADTVHAWLSLETYVEGIRAVGDTCFVRATHEETMASQWDPTSDGSAEAPIVVYGDNGTVWPNDTPGYPLIHHGAYKVYFYNDDNRWAWHHIHHDSITDQAIGMSISSGVRIEDCIFTRLYNSFGDIAVVAGGNTHIVDCAFWGNAEGADGTNIGVGIAGGTGIVRGCTFDDLYYAAQNTGLLFEDCNFGDTSVNTDDVNNVGGQTRMIGCTFAQANNFEQFDSRSSPGQAYIASQAYDASKRPSLYIELPNGSMQTDYDIVNSGGGDYSYKVAMTQHAGPAYPLRMLQYSVYADSAESRDYTISCYRNAAWTPAPTAAELFVEVFCAVGDSVGSSVSTAVLTDSLSWYDLTVSGVSPNHDGPVHVILWLGDTDSNGAIYIDPRLVATGETYMETMNWAFPDQAFLYTAPSAGGKPWQQIIGGIPDENDPHFRDPRGAVAHSRERVRAR